MRAARQRPERPSATELSGPGRSTGRDRWEPDHVSGRVSQLRSFALCRRAAVREGPSDDDCFGARLWPEQYRSRTYRQVTRPRGVAAYCGAPTADPRSPDPKSGLRLLAKYAKDGRGTPRGHHIENIARMTLLVKSRRLISSAMGGRAIGVVASVVLALERCLRDRCSARV
jgi:hypothetical protein